MIFTASTTTCSVCSSMEASPQRPTTSSWAITLIVVNNLWRPSVSCWHTRSSIPKTSSSSVATTSALASTEFTVSMTNVCRSCFSFAFSFLFFFAFFFSGVLRYMDPVKSVLLCGCFMTCIPILTTLISKILQQLGKRRYNIKLWKTFTDCFNCLPVAAIIDEKIFTMHGGLSPDLLNMEQIRRVMRPTDVPDTGMFWRRIAPPPTEKNEMHFESIAN